MERLELEGTVTATTLRPIDQQDSDFLYQVYASTREDELAILDWDDEQKEAFLKMQFNAQHAHYQQHFADAHYDLILLDGEPVGRLYLHRRSDEIRIIDIALLTEHRGKGIGSVLMHDVLEEATRAALPVRIHVERNNPALRLYQRLGFRAIAEQGVYWLMEWRPDRTAG